MYDTMMTYRLTKPLVCIPLGRKEPITLPVGTEVEKDDFLKTVGLTEVLLNGKLVTVFVQEFLESTKTLGEKP